MYIINVNIENTVVEFITPDNWASVVNMIKVMDDSPIVKAYTISTARGVVPIYIFDGKKQLEKFPWEEDA